MNEAAYHALAMRGGGALLVAEAAERQRAAQEAEELRRWQHGQRQKRQRWALAQPPRYRTRRGRLRVGQPTSGWPVLWAFVQWLGAALDYATPNFVQHIQPQPGEVIMLPFETLTYIGSSSWTPLTVVPGTLNPVNDVGTGLDKLNQNSNAPWGVDANGQPYYDTEGATRAAHMFVDGTGQPYVTP